MNWREVFCRDAAKAGCPEDQVRNLIGAGILLQPRQLVASAAARECDLKEGPIAIGYGGARGGGKSHWLLAQMGADDCQRVPGLKCLLLRKVGKANLEHFEDLRRKLFGALPHEFSAHRGVLTFGNGSRIVAGHFQNEKDIDAYLGLEYDVIGVEEATTLSSRKYQDISTCCRSSKTWTPANSQLSTPNAQPIPWRPRIYTTTNPGGVGHAWYRAAFVIPYLQKKETDTRFVPARVGDNSFNNPEYRRVLESLSGWQRRAWLDGDWDLAAGQFFTPFQREVHVVGDYLKPEGGNLKPELGRLKPELGEGLQVFDETRAREWFAALDYGFVHYTVVLLGCTDADGNMFVVDEHAERKWLPQRHAAAVKAMLARHQVPVERSSLSVEGEQQETRPLELSDLERFVAGADVFSRQCDGTSIAQQYAREGIRLRPANTDRINGWAEILQRLGDADAGIAPRLFIHKRCGRLLETLPTLQHDSNRPEDVLKVDADEEGIGGDDAADALRYMVATKPRTIEVRKLRGL